MTHNFDHKKQLFVESWQLNNLSTHPTLKHFLLILQKCDDIWSSTFLKKYTWNRSSRNIPFFCLKLVTFECCLNNYSPPVLKRIARVQNDPESVSPKTLKKLIFLCAASIFHNFNLNMPKFVSICYSQLGDQQEIRYRSVCPGHC